MYNEIKITRTLLEKPEETLTPKEKAAISSHKETEKSMYDRLEKANKRIVEDCKILCSGYERLPIPDYGWMNPVQELCYKLESLNHDYAKYGLSVILDQSKEKYATLHFYTHIRSLELGFWGRLIRCVDYIGDKLSNINFGMKTIVDRDAYKTVEWKEISKEQFDGKMNEINMPLDNYGRNTVVVNSKDDVKNFVELEDTVYLVNENGSYFYSYLLHHTAKTHMECTKHKFLYNLMNGIRSLSMWMSMRYNEPLIQRVMTHRLDYQVDDLIREATRRCEKVCQHCGMSFDDEYYIKCETQGWYTYICEDCAMAVGSEYRKGDKFYIEGKEIEHEKTAEVKE